MIQTEVQPAELTYLQPLTCSFLKDLAAENETFPAVRKLEGLWDLHRFNTVLWHKAVVLLAVFLQQNRWMCLQIVTACSNQGVHLHPHLDGVQLFHTMHSLNLQFSELAINCIAEMNESRHNINTRKCEWEHTETLESVQFWNKLQCFQCRNCYCKAWSHLATHVDLIHLRGYNNYYIK